MSERVPDDDAYLIERLTLIVAQNDYHPAGDNFFKQTVAEALLVLLGEAPKH